MSDLISQLPERGLETALRQVDQKNSEFKAAQRISGASGQLNYTGQSANPWDITQTITGGGMTKITLTTTMTCDGSQDWPEANLYMDVRAGGTGDANKFSYLTSVAGGSFYYAMLGWTDGTNIIGYGGRSRLYDATLKKFTWTVDFYYSGTITYYAKIALRSTCPGAATFARTL
ncbi:hypothetical protein J2X12_004326 [Pseudarthrobacter oxydans]|uniref:Uncharacterized protein n=1 Tax=Pseudarthrobacter oxydans TaxID=1671 RepID=A0AAW8NG01_PSEOX|nr:hypothetical protein [Pseudarthrobacter oxydans]MDR6794889.1 hypothetical protein [Pseudarthrobacter oxydans]MDR7166272.1 hypothetical protein [Pseudarthrobacter oxydans]